MGRPAPPPRRARAPRRCACRRRSRALLPGTSYHYRAVATSADGTTYGADTAFATAKAAPAAITGAASIVLTDGARLTGTVAPAGVETSYQFQYGPTAAYGQQTALSVAGSGTSKVSVGATISGLAAGTTYHYRLVAISADGTTAGADAAFTTTGDAASPGGPPPADLAHDGRRDHLEQRAARRRDQPPCEQHDVVVRVRAERRVRVRIDRRSMSGLGARPVNVRLAGLAASTTFHYRLELQSATGLYVGPDETFATKAIVRARPEGLTLSASARTQRRTVSISASGTLRSPLAGSCNGIVEVAIVRGAEIISLRSVALRADCTYRERLSLRAGATGHRVSVLAHFTGNATLLPQPARRVLVSIG